MKKGPVIAAAVATILAPPVALTVLLVWMVSLIFRPVLEKQVSTNRASGLSIILSALICFVLYAVLLGNIELKSADKSELLTLGAVIDLAAAAILGIFEFFRNNRTVDTGEKL